MKKHVILFKNRKYVFELVQTDQNFQTFNKIFLEPTKLSDQKIGQFDKHAKDSFPSWHIKLISFSGVGMGAYKK